jgi:dienelactone hydrolase
MKRFALFAALSLAAITSPAAERPTRADQALADYFRVELLNLSSNCLANVKSVDDWKSHRDEYRRQLQEMLGLWPMPERTDLKPAITGKLSGPGFTVEKLYFQASPRLYVTANLYLPDNADQPAPTILYECGHLRAVTNGISLGNKTSYQQDGAWYARNGYVCLVVDTVLAGEIQGIHTGTRDRGLWWWNSRGYTPAGVEAWFGIRALDYLSTRPEVDTNRFGITGHSGGGAYSWMVTALDDRIKAAAPLAGMADVQSHILDGVIDSHCDCNFFVNSYRWDFPQVASLAAPRPLLIGGTDNDGLFRLENTMRIHEKVRRLYQLYRAPDKLGLAMAPGPHDETPELQLAVMRWFNRHLKGRDMPVETTAKKFFAPTELKVFETLPPDAINTNIADTFVPVAKAERKSAEELRSALSGKVFTTWPGPEPLPSPKRLFSTERDGVRFSAWDFVSQHDVILRIYVLENAAEPAQAVRLNVLNQSGWAQWLETVRPIFGDVLNEELRGSATNGVADVAYQKLKDELTRTNVALAFFAPRGVGLNAWSGDERALTRIRRRFMLLGQTLDGMRVWDIRRAIQILREGRGGDSGTIHLRADGAMAVNALYAALFEPDVRRLDLKNLPKSQIDGPDYLGILKICDLPQVLEAEAKQAVIRSE